MNTTCTIRHDLCTRGKYKLNFQQRSRINSNEFPTLNCLSAVGRICESGAKIRCRTNHWEGPSTESGTRWPPSFRDWIEDTRVDIFHGFVVFELFELVSSSPTLQNKNKTKKTFFLQIFFTIYSYKRPSGAETNRSKYVPGCAFSELSTLYRSVVAHKKSIRNHELLLFCTCKYLLQQFEIMSAIPR